MKTKPAMPGEMYSFNLRETTKFVAISGIATYVSTVVLSYLVPYSRSFTPPVPISTAHSSAPRVGMAVTMSRVEIQVRVGAGSDGQIGLQDHWKLKLSEERCQEEGSTDGDCLRHHYAWLSLFVSIPQNTVDALKAWTLS